MEIGSAYGVLLDSLRVLRVLRALRALRALRVCSGCSGAWWCAPRAQELGGVLSELRASHVSSELRVCSGVGWCAQRAQSFACELRPSVSRHLGLRANLLRAAQRQLLDLPMYAYTALHFLAAPTSDKRRKSRNFIRKEDFK